MTSVNDIKTWQDEYTAAYPNSPTHKAPLNYKVLFAESEIADLRAYAEQRDKRVVELEAHFEQHIEQLKAKNAGLETMLDVLKDERDRYKVALEEWESTNKVDELQRECDRLRAQVSQPVGAVVTDELLPCPFCGCEMHFDSNRDWHRVKGGHLDDCVFDEDGEAIMVPATNDCKAWAAGAWNRRAALAAHTAVPVGAVVADELRNEVLEEVAALHEKFLGRGAEVDVGYMADSIRAMKQGCADLAAQTAAPGVTYEGCPKCGIKGIHACTGLAPQPWTNAQKQQLSSILEEYAPAPAPAAPLDISGPVDIPKAIEEKNHYVYLRGYHDAAAKLQALIDAQKGGAA